MRLYPGLLDALRITTVRSVEDYEALTRRRALASDHGSTRYQLREPERAKAPSGEALSILGNTHVGGMLVSYVTDRLGTRITFPEAHPLSLCIMTLLQGSMQFSPFGSGTVRTAGPGDMLLCKVEPGVEAMTTDGSERLNLWINALTLSRRLEAMLEQPLAAPLVFAPEQAWPQGVVGSLTRLVGYVAADLADPHSLFAGGVGAAVFEELVIRTLLEGVPHNHTERLARQPGTAQPQVVQRGIEFMRAHVADPVTVEDVAQAAGCSARALAAAFRRHREQTVTSALRDLRLDAARDAFAGDPALNVGDLAARLGFSNPGRFASQYRERFGEMPLQTRRSHAPIRPGLPPAAELARKPGRR